MRSVLLAVAISSLFATGQASHGPVQQQRNRHLRAREFGKIAHRSSSSPLNARADASYLALASSSNSSSEVGAEYLVLDSTSDTTTVTPPPVYEAVGLWFNASQFSGSENACGGYDDPTARIFGAPNTLWNITTDWDPNPALCGQKVFVTNVATNVTIITVLADASGNNFATLSLPAYQALGGDLNAGEINITYTLPYANSTGGGSSGSSSSSTIAISSSSSSVPVSSSSSVAAPVTTSRSTVALATPTSSPTEAPIHTTTTKTTTTSSIDLASITSSSEAAAAARQSSKEAAESFSSSSSAAAERLALSFSSSSSAAAAAESFSSSSRAAAAEESARESSSSSSAAAAASAAAKAKAKANSESSSSSDVGNLVGHATFFFQNGVAGACGTVHKDTDFVIALFTSVYDNGANCGRKVTITRDSDGATVSAIVADECPTCTSTDSIDLSVAAFTTIATEVEGQVNIHWKFDD